MACASTGNLAGAVAAHSAYAGLPAYVFIPADLEPEKILSAGAYGAQIIGVQGNYDAVNRLCTEVSGEHESWAFVNVNVRPYYAEGSKTLAYETAEQLGWELPDRVVAPIASGSLFTKVARGFQEFIDAGLLAGEVPAMHGAQAEGCSPVAQAYEAGTDVCRPVKPDTIAKSLAIGNPADGPYAVDLARRTGGSVEAVSDDEIRAGIRLLAQTTGIFTETAGGVTTATLAKLAAAGEIGSSRPRRRLHHRRRPQDARRRQGLVRGRPRSPRATASSRRASPRRWSEWRSRSSSRRSCATPPAAPPRPRAPAPPWARCWSPSTPRTASCGRASRATTASCAAS